MGEALAIDRWLTHLILWQNNIKNYSLNNFVVCDFEIMKNL